MALITLAVTLVFGIYFALRLARAGEGPPGAARALGFGVLALASRRGSRC